MKKILTILILLFNLVVRRKHYTLKFVAECDGTADNPKLVKLWYYHFPLWGFDKHNLLMVAGADTLCELYAKGKNGVTVEIIASRKDLGVIPGYEHFIGWKMEGKHLDNFLFGRTYYEDPETREKKRNFWICPVTLFVLGRYPNHIYIKKNT